MGYAGLPGVSRGQARDQALYVNGRPVRDRALAGAIRAAYGDLLMSGRHPAFVLYLACPPLYRLSQGGKTLYAIDDADKDRLIAGRSG